MIASVLAQSINDWELIILNDHQQQTLIDCTADSRIHVHNVPFRYPDIASKHNAAFALATAPVMTLIDDDDLMCPHRLEVMLDGLKDGIYGTQWYWQFHYQHGLRKTHGTLHWNYAFERSMLNEIGGYQMIPGKPFDMVVSVELKRRLRAAGNETDRHLLNIHRIHAPDVSYNITHLQLTQPNLNARVDYALGEIQTGNIPIKPDASALQRICKLIASAA